MDSVSVVERQPAVPPSIVPLRTSGNRPPLFCVHPHFGLAHPYIALADLLGPDQPVYGLQAPGIEEGQSPLKTIPEMAALYVDSIREIQPHGPYCLAGWSLGAPVAYEMACKLHDLREEVSFLGLLDGQPRLKDGLPYQLRLLNREAQLSKLREEYLAGLTAEIGISENEIGALPIRDRAALYIKHADGRGRLPAGLNAGQFERVLQVIASNYLAMAAYNPVPYPVSAVLLRVPSETREDTDYGWSRLALGGLQVLEIAAIHDDLLSPPAIRAVATALQSFLAATESVTAASSGGRP